MIGNDANQNVETRNKYLSNFVGVVVTNVFNIRAAGGAGLATRQALKNDRSVDSQAPGPRTPIPEIPSALSAWYTRTVKTGTSDGELGGYEIAKLGDRRATV